MAVSNGEAIDMAHKINGSVISLDQLTQEHCRLANQNLEKLGRILNAVYGPVPTPSQDDEVQNTADRAGRPSIATMMNNNTFVLTNTSVMLDALERLLGQPLNQQPTKQRHPSDTGY